MVRNEMGEPRATHLRRNDRHRAELHARQCQVATWHMQMPVTLLFFFRVALRLAEAPRHEGGEKTVESRHAIGTLGTTRGEGKGDHTLPAGMLTEALARPQNGLTSISRMRGIFRLGIWNLPRSWEMV